MKPEQAKRQLEQMLLSFSPGSVLMLLGEVFGQWTEEARGGGSEIIADNLKEAEATVKVVDLGLDAILSKPKER
jgi:hypothetical protein